MSAWISDRVIPDFENAKNVDIKRGVSEDFFYDLLCNEFLEVYNDASFRLGFLFIILIC